MKRLNDSHVLLFSTLMALSVVCSNPIFFDFDVVRGIFTQISVQRYEEKMTYANKMRKNALFLVYVRKKQ